MNTWARFPGLLEIDVDNGDCEYLADWVATGYRPLVIEMEVVHSYLPPELALSFPFNGTCWGTCAQGAEARGGGAVGPACGMASSPKRFERGLSAQFGVHFCDIRIESE